MIALPTYFNPTSKNIQPPLTTFEISKKLKQLEFLSFEEGENIISNLIQEINYRATNKKNLIQQVISISENIHVHYKDFIEDLLIIKFNEFKKLDDENIQIKVDQLLNNSFE